MLNISGNVIDLEVNQKLTYKIMMTYNITQYQYIIDLFNSYYNPGKWIVFSSFYGTSVDLI